MEQWFEKKVALVTGGGSGIGRASALLFAGRGARVIVADHDQEMADATVRAIIMADGDAIAAYGDVAAPSTAHDWVETALRHYGRLDTAFNNAGITMAGDGEWDEGAFRATLDVNLFGVMACMKHQIPAMLRSGGGTIVNNASINGLIASMRNPLPGYTASKHAVIGLTKSAALQYGRQNIRVNAICPGVTDTAIVRQVTNNVPEALAAIASQSPMGRIAQPEEMAEAAIWLASEKSSFVNAHALVVDGGYVAQ